MVSYGKGTQKYRPRNLRSRGREAETAAGDEIISVAAARKMGISITFL